MMDYLTESVRAEKNNEMKKKLKLAMVVMLICGLVSVQAQQAKFYAGGKAGFGIPSLAVGSGVTPLSEDYAFRLTYYGGFVFEVQSDNWLGFRTEVNYSSEGGERSGMQAIPLSNQLKQLWGMLSVKGVKHDNYMYADLQKKAYYTYVEVPLLAKCTFGSGSRFNFYLTTGPFIGFLVKARQVTKGFNSIYIDKFGDNPVDKYLEGEGMSVLGQQSFNNVSNITGSLNRINAGWQSSLGFEILLKSGKIFVDIGGSYGFVPVQKDRSNGTNTTDNGIVTIGYAHRL
jgi:hypothetical protein